MQIGASFIMSKLKVSVREDNNSQHQQQKQQQQQKNRRNFKKNIHIIMFSKFETQSCIF